MLTESENRLIKVMRLRMLVGFLGERARFAWWPTAFFEPSSRLFLEPVFPKTSRLVQYHGVLEAARRLHDEHLNVGSYHLFRLPEEIEQDLHSLMQSGESETLLGESHLSKEAALNALSSMAGGTRHDAEGPTAVGSEKTLDFESCLATIAAAYLSAFTNDVKTYPYLAS